MDWGAFYQNDAYHGLVCTKKASKKRGNIKAAKTPQELSLWNNNVCRLRKTVTKHRKSYITVKWRITRYN